MIVRVFSIILLLLLQNILCTAVPFTDREQDIYVRTGLSVNDRTAQLADRAE